MNKCIVLGYVKQILVVATVLLMPSYNILTAQLLIDFDELSPPKQGNGDRYFDGYGASATKGTWSSQGASFNTNMFGPGFSYSDVDDVTTPGFQNQWAAITGGDFSRLGNYALASTFIENGAFINLPENQQPESIRLTNSTYAFLSMQNGDAFAKQFGGDDGNDPDFFIVRLQGFSEIDTNGDTTGQVVFYLADFRFDDNANDFIVDTWELVDLRDLGDAQSIGYSFDSSDVGNFGINTPAYVAFDELYLTPSNLLGDVNQDGMVDLLDVSPFVDVLLSGDFQPEADINQDGLVNLLDVAPFVELLSM